MKLYIIKALHEKKPQDRQYIYMMPGGNHNNQKRSRQAPSITFIDGKR
jgi:hypothetical protein